MTTTDLTIIFTILFALELFVTFCYALNIGFKFAAKKEKGAGTHNISDSKYFAPVDISIAIWLLIHVAILIIIF